MGKDWGREGRLGEDWGLACTESRIAELYLTESEREGDMDLGRRWGSNGEGRGALGRVGEAWGGGISHCPRPRRA